MLKKKLIQCTQKSSKFSIEAFALPYLTKKTALYLNDPDSSYHTVSDLQKTDCELHTPQAVLTHCCTTLDSKNTLLSIASLLLLLIMRERERQRGAWRLNITIYSPVFSFIVVSAESYAASAEEVSISFNPSSSFCSQDLSYSSSENSKIHNEVIKKKMQ